MLVKRYHARDMQQAMVQIIKELGSDAVILSSKKVRQKGLRNLFKGRILEVMVAYDPDLVPGAKPPARAPAAAAPALTEQQAGREAAVMAAAAISMEQFERLDKRIDTLDGVLADFIQKFSYVRRDVTYDYTKEVEELFCALRENQVREELAHIIARETDAVLKKQPDTTAYEVMEQIIAERLGTPAPIQPKKFKQKLVLFIGPTGVGKTTSIVKLAADFAVTQKKKIGIINTDTYRIAAQEQLETYADILNIPLSVVYRMSELTGEIEAMSDREIIFIDTTGKRPGDEKHAEDISSLLSICSPEEIHLCVPATVSFASLKEIVDSYSYIDNYKLLVTKLDETRYRGMILNLSWYAGKELSYFTTGQNVPDDIEKINVEALVGEILGQRR